MLDFNKRLTCFRVLVCVWVVLFRKGVVGFFDVGGGGGAFDAEDFVGVALGLREVRGAGVEGLRWLVSEGWGGGGDGSEGTQLVGVKVGYS